jgi:hypothetical protein
VPERANDQPTTIGAVEIVARLVGLTIPAEHAEGLASALDEQVAAFDRLAKLDLPDIEPVTTFDPHWRG